jgi:predicted amidohydrolase YtcJ
MRYASALLLLMLMARTAAGGDGKPAERLFLHGEILTGEGLTSQPRRVLALALAFGTDYPVESVRPLRGLYAAVTRLPEPAEAAAAAQPYFPEERLSIAKALYAYTQGSAYAEGMERLKGRLLAGQLADFVVLDRDLLRAAPQEILNAHVLRTVVGGRTVFESK